MTVLGLRLDSTILKVFCNINYSMILLFYKNRDFSDVDLTVSCYRRKDCCSFNMLLQEVSGNRARS